MLRTQPLQQLVNQRGLSGAYLARQQDESFAALDAIGETSQGLLRVPRQKQIPRIGIDIKRICSKPEKFLVHSRLDLDHFFFFLFRFP